MRLTCRHLILSDRYQLSSHTPIFRIVAHFHPDYGTGGDIFNEFIEKFLVQYGGEGNTYRILISRLEKALLNRIGPRFNDNKSEIARFLGISRVTLQKKLEDLKS